MKKSKKQLPYTLLPIPCSDKEEWSESWSAGRNWLNIPHPWRGVFTGPPSSGKSTAIKNIIVRAKPKFKEVIVCHLDENSTEWKDCDAKMIKELPEPTSFDRTRKRLLILEDLNLSDMSKADKNKLNRLMGYTSSHCNLSIAITCQNAYDLSPSIRRMANLYVIFKQPDMNSLIILASRTGLKSKHMLYIISRLLKNPHSSLWINTQRNCPAPYAADAYNAITLEQLDQAIKSL
jgi:hypothetical protein